MENNQTIDLQRLQDMKTELTRFMMVYQFACDEMNTKINILSDEFTYLHDYNPIEHVKSRVKSPESIFKKVKRKGCEFSLPSIKENIRDIAGVRITCSFLSDVHRLADMLLKQKDITLVEYKDYVNNPKPNGYKSLHLIVQIPIFMTDRIENTYVELQIRTIAMDFWASLEHKIYYKYDKEIPSHLQKELHQTALIASELDKKMESLHKEVVHIKKENEDDHPLALLADLPIGKLLPDALSSIAKPSAT